MALLVATYQYQDSGLRQLTSPVHDAESLAAVLSDPVIADFEVTTLINEPYDRVGQAIGELYRDRRRDDLTLLYFTGHGLKDDGGRLYLAMANTQRDNLPFTALPASQIDYVMEGCASRQKILILDCCYSGAFPASRLVKADAQVYALESFQGRGRVVLTASDTTQYSFEGNQPHGQAKPSVFTHHLIVGLRDGSADLNGDGDITLDELYSYVYDRVVEEIPQQRPKKQDDVEGRIVIARNINWSLPTHLRHAINSPIATDRLNALEGLAHLHRIGNDVVRGRVGEEIHSLVDDDSRRVSAAAAAQIRSIVPQPAEQPTEKGAKGARRLRSWAVSAASASGSVQVSPPGSATTSVPTRPATSTPRLGDWATMASRPMLVSILVVLLTGAGMAVINLEGYSGELCGSCKTAVELRRYASDQDR
ncbi:MAG: caspase family protein [Pseudonocardia sp.]